MFLKGQVTFKAMFVESWLFQETRIPIWSRSALRLLSNVSDPFSRAMPFLCHNKGDS